MGDRTEADEAPDVDAGLTEGSPKPARGVPETTEPIVDETDTHTVASFGGQELRELSSCGIRSDMASRAPRWSSARLALIVVTARRLRRFVSFPSNPPRTTF